MVRNLYRFYLYTVFIVLLIFSAIALGQLLATVLLFVPFLHASYETVPTQAQVVQSLVFALVAWIIAGLLGGLHYWLIRRDIHTDPAAGGSAIRAFFLNIAEAISIAIGVPFLGFVVLGQLAHSGQYVIAGSAAFSIATLAFAGVLALERRRTQVGSGAALAFQRLHVYGVQLLSLIFLSFAWSSNVNGLIDSLFYGGRGTREYCGSPGSCQSLNVGFLFLTLLWFVCFWLAYGWLTRNDTSKFLRFILHFLSAAAGIAFVLNGLYRGVLLLLLPAFKVSFVLQDVVGPAAQYDFAPFILLGVLVIGVYHLWLTMASKQGLIERRVVVANEMSIAAILAALLFWGGIAFLLYSELRALNAASPEAEIWAENIAAILVGLVYIPLDLYLWRRNSGEPTVFAGARRGFVLAVLGVGLLAFAIGGAVALYAWTTSLFSSPIPNWLQVTHAGLAAFVAGGVVTVLYLTIAIRERLFSGFTKRGTPAVPASTPVVNVPPATIENVLDELLGGKITRDEAARRIRDLEDGLVSASN
ncbi:MAG: hypothetical protein NVS4B12_11570 [Ktedonobacteraceae bacterium]